MFEIKDDVIHVTRASTGVIEFEIPGYTFKAGDTIELRIYERAGLNELPLKTKEITVKEDAYTLDIELTCEDTDIGKPDNKVVEYWYEIELNDEQTILGYDEKGAKVLKLYPKGVEEPNVESQTNS